MSLILDDYQRQAVEATIDQHVLVSAPPGSGKTRVLTARYLYLVEQGFDPKDIIAVTFTNKAANELKQRLSSTLKMPQEGIKKLPVATFHSLCARWLRKHASKLGYSPRFSIYEDNHTRRILEDIEIDMGLTGMLPPCSAILSALKSQLITPDSLPTMLAEGRVPRLYDGSSISQSAWINIAQVYDRYQRKLRSLDAMDFDDLILNTVLLLDAGLFKPNATHLLVDECQDINAAQYGFIQRLADAGVRAYLVGDIQQSIYGFRGSRPDLIDTFAAEYRPQVFNLRYNYRSRQAIVDVSSQIIKPNCEGLAPVVYTVKEGGEIKWYNIPPACFLSRPSQSAGSHRWPPSPGNLPLLMVRGFLESGLEPKDMAVLCRYSRPLQDLWVEFVNGSVPARLVRSQRSLRTPVRSLLAVLVNPRDHINLYDLLLFFPGIGEKTAAAICSSLSSNGDFIAQLQGLKAYRSSASPNTKVGNSLGKLIEVMDSAYRLLQSTSPGSPLQPVLVEMADSIYGAIPGSSLMSYTEATELVLQAADNYTVDADDIVQFLSFLNLVSSETAADAVCREKGREDQKKNLVTLSTIHAAKGLEYRVVLIIEALYANHYRLTPEERRVFYVAVTRAIDRAYIISYYPLSLLNSENCFVRMMLADTGITPVNLTNDFMCSMAAAAAV